MLKGKIFLILLFCGLFVPASKAQNLTQTAFDSLVPRMVDLRQIENILGPPDSRTKIFEWSGRYRSDGAFKGFDYENTECRYDYGRDFIKRNMYEMSYPELKLKLHVFDNPWRLYSVETTNREISVLGVKIGDALEDVQKTLGKGKWQTTEGSDVWYLAYEKKGLRLVFLRDTKVKQFPMRLAADQTIVRMEIFDPKTSFVGCSKSPAYD